MVENLVNLITELSRETVRQALSIENNDFENRQNGRSFNKYVRELRQKCLDVIIQSNPERECSDPCKTDYGADWSPLSLILDYVGELANYGAVKASKRLIANVEALEGKNYACLQDMYKLIFLLRGSYIDMDAELQPAFLSTVSAYSIKSHCPTAVIHADIYGLPDENTLPSQGICKKYSANLFESGCQLLSKLSNRNVVLESGKQRHLSVSTSKILGPSVLSDCSDLILKQKSFSNSSFMQVASSLYSSNHSLWDNFVEKPITYKLKRVQQKCKSPCLAESSGGSGEHIKNSYKSCERENIVDLRKPDDYWTEVHGIEKILKLECDNKENLNKPKIDLYPILKENKLKLESYESCFDRKIKSGDKNSKQKIRNSFFQSSETLILALWEQEVKFRCTYNPTVTSCVPEMRVLQLEQFLRDVQYLLVGIGTDTFLYNGEDFLFKLKEGTCLEGITPNTLLIFSKEYLDIGECYIKLSHHTGVNLKQQMISGSKNCRIVFKVFWMSIYEYLCRHTKYVLKIPVNSGLLEFKSYVRNIYPIITAVAQVCKVEENDGLPQGGQLLSYILQATEKINNKCAAGVLFGILKACCETYLVQLLQEWMFQGHLGRHHGDFFVEHRPKNPRCKDRSYYLSFFMFQDRIPFFLKGLENNIFNCGKTIHLLKLIQPNSKLCRLLETRTYPTMKLCLSERELKEQTKVFQYYAENVAKICGRFMSIASLKLQEITKVQNYEKYIMEVKKEQELERVKLKKESMEELRRKREEQNHWLNKQIQLAAEEKKKKREQERKESEVFLDQVLQIAERERKIVDEEKCNIKMFYEELVEEIDKKTEALTWKQRSLQLNKKNAMLRDCKSDDEICVSRKTHTEYKAPEFSLLGGDKIVDHEGNIISCEVLFTKPDLDIVNSNVDSVENQLEDIENENFAVSGEADAQLQKLIDSRKEYQCKVETGTVTLRKESERVCSKVESDVSKTVKKDSNQSPKSVKTKTERKKLETTRSPIKASDKEKKMTGMTEAQKNKRKMMSCELGIGARGDQEKKPVRKGPPPDSEAVKNKMKVMASEYGVLLNCKRKGRTEVGHKKKVETEAEKNKKKVMSSEYGLPLKVGKEAKPDKKPVSPETEAERNKKKILGTEFGESKPVYVKGKPTSVCGEEAKKNKRQVLEIEYGYPKESNLTTKTAELEAKVLKVEQLKVSESAGDIASEYLTEEEKLEQYLNSELLTKPSSIAEKSLEIFNKRNSSTDDMRFFTLKENTSDESLPGNLPWLNYSEVQILFEQHLRRPMNNSDLTAIAAGFAGMDSTTFMNCIRQSLLIPLQVQEAIANEALFNHLLKKENMLSHFNALRNYFFLNDGEFSRRLTQNMFVTLAKCKEPEQFFKRSTMNQIVYEALNYTIHSSEPHTQNVSFEIVCMPAFLSHASHDVLSPFDLSYQVKWPLNIIITEKALSKYKLVFHFLLKLKRINWTLNENFSYLTYSCKEKNVKSRLLINSPHYHKIHIYRHAMGQFMRTLENYTSSCSLQFSWLNFEKELESAKNLDHLYEKHVRYIKEVLKRCFLTKESHELLTCINNLIELSLKFHYATKSGSWVLTNGVYKHTKFDVLKKTFIDYCNLTTEFLRTLRKKINNYHDLKPHEVLMEKFDMILR